MKEKLSPSHQDFCGKSVFSFIEMISREAIVNIPMNLANIWYWLDYNHSLNISYHLT